jgi:histidinol-phosphate aminotransferase
VGFGVAHPEICDLLNRVRLPFNVNSLAQTAAVAALRDQEFVQRSRRVNDEGMRQLIRGFERLRLATIPSVGNFITVRVGDAGPVYQRLLRQGVIVRPVGAYGLPEHLRVTIGVESENARFLQALEAALHA